MKTSKNFMHRGFYQMHRGIYQMFRGAQQMVFEISRLKTLESHVVVIINIRVRKFNYI